MRKRSKLGRGGHSAQTGRGAAGSPAISKLENRTLLSATLSPHWVHPWVNHLGSSTRVNAPVTSGATARGGYVPPPKLVVSRIAISPANLSLADGTAFPYAATAYDQHGNALAVPPAFTWSVVNGGAGGTVSTSGLYTAPAAVSGTSTVQVSAGGVKNNVAVVNTAAGLLTADSDVGSPALAGHYSFNGTTYTVSGSGSDIWNSADQFNFPRADVTGDTVLEARVTSVGNTDPWAKAGVMFRQLLSATSQDVCLVDTPQHLVQLIDRSTNGGPAVVVGQASTGTTGPIWLKLVRNASSFEGFWGTDGTTWNQLGTATVPMNSTVAAGLVACSHNVGLISTSTFDNVQIMSQPISGIYRISTLGQPGMSLDIAGFGNANETPVQLYTANYTSNQQWYVQEQGDGTYLIYAYSARNSLQMLDLTNGSTTNGNLVNTYQQNGTPAQQWLFVPEGNGAYRIVPKNGENTLQTLDMQNGNSAVLGSRTEIYGYWGGNNQLFTLKSPGTLKVLPSPKKGLAGYLGETSSINNSWGYDWGTGGASQLPAGAEYDPMVWGYYGNANNNFTNYVKGIVASGAKSILGFNEPDSSSQANLSVASALEGWGLMQNASNGVPLVSPAAVNDTDSWMQSFMSGAAAKGYRIDAVAIHWYGGNDPNGFINYVNTVHNMYNKPIWITEFCPADWSGNGGVSVANATSFMQQVIPQLNAMSFVQRYSWFSASTTDRNLGQGALFNSNGSLTPLGQLYSRM